MDHAAEANASDGQTGDCGDSRSGEQRVTGQRGADVSHRKPVVGEIERKKPDRNRQNRESDDNRGATTIAHRQRHRAADRQRKNDDRGAAALVRRNRRDAERAHQRVGKGAIHLGKADAGRRFSRQSIEQRDRGDQQACERRRVPVALPRGPILLQRSRYERDDSRRDDQRRRNSGCVERRENEKTEERDPAAKQRNDHRRGQRDQQRVRPPFAAVVNVKRRRGENRGRRGRRRGTGRHASGRPDDRDRDRAEERRNPSRCELRPVDDTPGELRRVVKRTVLRVESREPAPPRMRFRRRRQTETEYFVEPETRLTQRLESKNGAGRDRGQQREERQGVLGTSTQSVDTGALWFPLLSHAVTSYRYEIPT